VSKAAARMTERLASLRAGAADALFPADQPALAAILSREHHQPAPSPFVELRHHAVHSGLADATRAAVQQAVGGAVELGVGGLSGREGSNGK
jgi:hypothetical protein